MDDFAVLGKVWHEAFRAGSHDVVVFDGPATGHLRQTLAVPAAVLRTTSRGPLARDARAVLESLHDPKGTQAVLVGWPELWPLTELSELGSALRTELGLNIGCVVVNGVHDPELLGLAGLDPSRFEDRALAEVVERVLWSARIAERHHEILTSWQESTAAEECAAGCLVRIPWWWDGLENRSDLDRLLTSLEAEHLRDRPDDPDQRLTT
jgi:anion-transporting  ArsA/GET3 family ATPase